MRDQHWTNAQWNLTVIAVRDKSFLILHGIENHRPPAHWQFWLAARLAEAGQNVLYPALPNPDAPCYRTWDEALHRQLAALAGDDRVVICHSLSCLLWLRAAGGIAEAERPTRLLLASPPASSSVPEAAASFRLRELDVRAIRRSVTDQIRVVCSEDDPYNRVGARTTYAEPLGAQIDVVPGAGHITAEDGYGPWPSLFEWCLAGDGAVE
jgi:predicted alpha/beta hydrolase family esterase